MENSIHDRIHAVDVSRLTPLMNDRMLERFRTLPFVPKGAVISYIPYFTGGTEGNIALYARVRDYHGVMYEYMLDYERELSARFPGMRFMALKNGWPLPVVPAANMCGVGFTGRHGLQIVEPYGSYVTLGAVLCDSLLPETPPEGECAGCGECEGACPTGAMRFDGEKRALDRSRCISGVTQTKGGDNLDLIKLSPYIWGCDICQRVCPHNKDAKITDIPEFTDGIISDIDSGALSGDLSGRHYSKALDLIKRNLEIRGGAI